MRVLFSCLVAGLLFAGCSHSPKTPVVEVNFPKDNIHYIKPGERQPAQMQAAPVLTWQPAILKYNVSSASLSATQNVVVTQEMKWKEIKNQFETRMVYKDVEIPGTCSAFVCSGGGTSQLWNEVYKPNQTRAQKAKALANAIEGIGEVSSQNLAEKSYFSVKPASWDAFAAEIKRASDNGVITKTVATKVLTNYRYENINKLGYTKSSCQERTYSCTTTVEKLVPVQVAKPVEVEQRQITQSKPFIVSTTINGAQLLPFEKDAVSVVIDENGQAILDYTNGFNRYSITRQEVRGPQVNIEITADSRVLRDLPNNVVRQDSFSMIGEKPTFVLDIDSQYLPNPSNDPDAQLVIDYTTYICEYGWTGTCGFSSWKKQSMGSAVLKEARTILPFEAPLKNKAYIEYKISMKNGKYFNDKGTYPRATDEVKMPKR